MTFVYEFKQWKEEYYLNLDILNPHTNRNYSATHLEILIYMLISVIYWSFVTAAADDISYQSFNIQQFSSWLVPCLFCFHTIVSFLHMLFVTCYLYDFFPSKEYD